MEGIGLFGFREDVMNVLQKDPAARSRLEVILTYPGLHAVWAYRIAHWLYKHGFRITAKLLAYFTRMVTGIEIHPGATIGRRLFIDHGHGVVIGETAVVGDDVTMFHGVTLGGTGKDRGKRHPTVGNGVLLSAGVKILGPITIGDESKIGAGAVVLTDVPPRCTVVGVPGRIVKRDGDPVRHRDDEKSVDNLNLQLEALRSEVEKLRFRIDMIHRMLDDPKFFVSLDSKPSERV